MFTAKDLEVYKDALKEKKSKPTKTGEKPSKTPPSAAKAFKLPLKLQNEEPIKERKPLSVVHKASNTIKDPHKPPSSIPAGTSNKQANPGVKTKEITFKGPSLGLPTEANSLVKASDIRSEPLKSPGDSSVLKPSHIKPDDNKIAGIRKLKEPSTPRASNGVLQKSPSLSGAKVAPPANVEVSLCSECTRAASEGAVCFIGNDGRVSACTTRSAVRLCKNLNCAANNPEYVAAMANAPKKYLISKRHSLKAQYGLKSKSGQQSKAPNLQQTAVAGNEEWHHSRDAQNPSNCDVSPLNGASIDTSLNNFALDCEDGDLSPANRSLRLDDDGDTSLLDENNVFCDGEMGLMDDVMRGTACMEDYAAAETCIAAQSDLINEQNELGFHEGEVGETKSPKLSLELSREHIEALAEVNGYNATHPYANAESFELAKSDELKDVDVHGSPNLRASDTDMSAMKDHEDTSQNGDGEQVDGKAWSGDMAEMIGTSQVEDANQNSDVMLMTDSSQPPDGEQTGDKLESNQVADDKTIGGVASTVDANQVTRDIISVITTSQPVQDDVKSGGLVHIETGQVGDDDDSTLINDMHVAHNSQNGVKSRGLMYIETGQVGDDDDLTLINDMHVAHNNQNGGTENNNDDKHSGDDGEINSHIFGYVAADNDYGNDVRMLNGGHAGDDVPLVNGALGATITSPNGGHHVDQANVHALLNDQHSAGNDQCHDLASPHGIHVVIGDGITLPTLDTQVDDEGDHVPSPDNKCKADNEGSDETAIGHEKQVLEHCLSNGLTFPNDRQVADDDESDEDCNEDGETDEIEGNIHTADDSRPIIDLQESLDSTMKYTGSEGEDGSGMSSNLKKGSKHRRRRVLNAVEESNPERVTLRKQQTQERKQAEEWMLNYAIEGVVHKLAPTGEGKVKILVEAFESIISHTDVEGIDTHNTNREKHTLA